MINQEKMHKVEELIELISRLGFFPDTRPACGMIIPDHSNPFFSELCFRTSIMLSKHSIGLTVSSSENNPVRDYEIAESMAAVGLDAILVVRSDDDDDLDKEIVSIGTPLIFVDRPSKVKNTTNVFTDQRGGIKQLFDLLVEEEIIEIGCIFGPENVSSGRIRNQAIKREAKKRSIRILDSMLGYGDFSIESGYSATQEILKSHAVFDAEVALICCNDSMAIGAIRAAKDKKVDVPNQLRVIGFDDIHIGAWMSPRLTTIAQPIDIIVSAIEGQLMGKGVIINDDNTPPINQKIKTTLIRRESF